jgi:hypothetical protein
VTPKLGTIYRSARTLLVGACSNAQFVDVVIIVSSLSFLTYALCSRLRISWRGRRGKGRQFNGEQKS